MANNYAPEVHHPLTFDNKFANITQESHSLIAQAHTLRNIDPRHVPNSVELPLRHQLGNLTLRITDQITSPHIPPDKAITLFAEPYANSLRYPYSVDFSRQSPGQEPQTFSITREGSKPHYQAEKGRSDGADIILRGPNQEISIPATATLEDLPLWAQEQSSKLLQPIFFGVYGMKLLVTGQDTNDLWQSVHDKLDETIDNANRPLSGAAKRNKAIRHLLSKVLGDDTMYRP